MSWFSRSKAPKPSFEDSASSQLPGGLWEKCSGCGEIIYSKELTRNKMVCPKCGYHSKITTEQRIAFFCDRQSFQELDKGLRSNDPLNFRDSFMDKKRYKDKLKAAEKEGYEEAVRTGVGKLNGRKIYLGLFESGFIGGSMGIVAGEKLTRMIETATADNSPVVIFCSSGGARMQEGLYSLMQMAKVTGAIQRHGEKRLPYISVMADPTTGGVAASFAMLGDVNIAEPGALIGFAGPKVIEQTIRATLPEGFQRAEFLLDHGMLDMIVERGKLRDTIAKLLDVFCAD